MSVDEATDYLGMFITSFGQLSVDEQEELSEQHANLVLYMLVRATKDYGAKPIIDSEVLPKLSASEINALCYGHEPMIADTKIIDLVDTFSDMHNYLTKKKRKKRG